MEVQNARPEILEFANLKEIKEALGRIGIYYKTTIFLNIINLQFFEFHDDKIFLIPNDCICQLECTSKYVHLWNHFEHLLSKIHHRSIFVLSLC